MEDQAPQDAPTEQSDASPAEATQSHSSNRRRLGFIAAPLAAIAGVIGFGHLKGGHDAAPVNSAPVAATTPETTSTSTTPTTEAPTTTTLPAMPPGVAVDGASQVAGQPEVDIPGGSVSGAVEDNQVTTTTAISHNEVVGNSPFDAKNPNYTEPEGSGNAFGEGIVQPATPPATNVAGPGEVVTQKASVENQK